MDRIVLTDYSSGCQPVLDCGAREFRYKCAFVDLRKIKVKSATFHAYSGEIGIGRKTKRCRWNGKFDPAFQL